LNSSWSPTQANILKKPVFLTAQLKIFSRDKVMGVFVCKIKMVLSKYLKFFGFTFFEKKVKKEFLLNQ